MLKRSFFLTLIVNSTKQALTSLCWQRSKPVDVNESSCTDETALVGDAIEDSVLMPDPLPPATSLGVSLSTAVSSSRNPSHLGTSIEASSLTASRSEFSSSMLNVSAAEETPQKSHLWPIGTLTRLHASHNLKDDMDVFSPLVDVQPITPYLWDENEAKKYNIFADRKLSSLLFRSSSRRFLSTEEGSKDHPIFDWKSGSTSKQVPFFFLTSTVLNLTALCDIVIYTMFCVQTF